jgi:hypothetical protein
MGWSRVLLLLLSADLACAQPEPGPPVRGGKVEWARLKTSAPYWDRHADLDRSMLEFFRQHTSINVGNTWHAVGADLESLANYPFLFAQNIAPLSAAERRALGEYLRRGGFLFIDACVNAGANPDLNQFLREQVEILRAELPDLTVEALPPKHEVFSIHFKLKQFPPTGSPGSTAPLRALMSGDRTIGLLSLSGIQCGRAGFGEASARQACTEMMTNIYVYAITR